MSKQLLVGVVILVGIIAGIGGFLYLQNVREADKQNVAEQQKRQQTNDSTTPPAQDLTTPGDYEDYSAEKLASTKGDRVLFFHASWCPQCRSIDSGITDDKVPKGTTLFKVDYDSNQALRQKYGVTLQTTFVRIDANGDSVEKYVAYTKPTFDEVKKNFLDR